MSCSEDKVKEIIYDDNNIVRAIEQRPHSYYTILGEHLGNGTFQVILRRRIRRLIKQNIVWKIRVPGTRFGLVLLLHPKRDYIIVTKNSSLGVNVYYCYNINESDSHVFLNDYYELEGLRWSNWVHKTEELKLLKSDNREGGVIVWY